MQLTKCIENLMVDNLDFMSTCKDDQFDWAICDPNFGIGASRPSKKPDTCLQKNGKRLKVKTSDYKHKAWDDKPPPRKYFDEVKRVSKNQIIWGVNYYEYPLTGGRLIWDKLNGSTDQFDCEIAYLSFTKRTEVVYYLWSGMMQGIRAGSDVRTAYKQRGNKKTNEERIHPTQKPIALCTWILNKWVNAGETVFDSHSGSLSLGIACELRGISFTGCDNDEDYFLDSKSRVERTFSTKGLLSL